MNKKGFTLGELMIVVALITLVSSAFLAVFNPFSQIAKGKDKKRKSDLHTLKTSLEDFYNDKGYFPRTNDICFDNATGDDTDGYSCHICNGELPTGLDLPCDPKHPTEDYLYHVPNNNSPQSYWVYSNLDYENDPIIEELGCDNGSCGPLPNGPFVYEYGISSTNVSLESN
jgi:prepilin-type N-terminal cleavage/methylation domain-containing protein